MILLDTHAWIWHYSGDRRIAASVPALEAAADAQKLALSVISVWEVAMLVSKRRLKFGKIDPKKWIHSALAHRGLRLLALDAEATMESSFLPGTFHKDPADRIIVATARLRGATIATRDRKILAYAEQGFVKAMPV
jgi:PIN domain nuclease of toxin-antitoxin system